MANALQVAAIAVLPGLVGGEYVDGEAPPQWVGHVVGHCGKASGSFAAQVWHRGPLVRVARLGALFDVLVAGLCGPAAMTIKIHAYPFLKVKSLAQRPAGDAAGWPLLMMGAGTA